MITNQRQYRITQAAAQRFRDAIAEMEATGPPKGTTTRQHQAALEGQRAQLLELEQQLKAYDTLTNTAPGRTRLSGSFEQLGLALTQARLARGWTQAKLADRLGLHMQQIQDYEARGYDRASASRIQEVLNALGAKVTIDLTLIAVPAGLEEAMAEASTRKPRARAKR